MATTTSFNTIPQLLKHHAHTYGNKPYLFFADDPQHPAITYKQAYEEINIQGTLYASLDIKKGDVISLLLPNSPLYLLTLLSCWNLGYLANPINYQLSPDEIMYILRDAKAKLVILNSE